MIHYRILDRGGEILHSSTNMKHFDGWMHEQSAIDVALDVARDYQYVGFRVQLQRNKLFWEDVHNILIDKL